LAKNLDKNIKWHIPGWISRTWLRNWYDMLTIGEHVEGNYNFDFKFPTIETALNDLVVGQQKDNILNEKVSKKTEEKQAI